MTSVQKQIEATLAAYEAWFAGMAKGARVIRSAEGVSLFPQAALESNVAPSTAGSERGTNA